MFVDITLLLGVGPPLCIDSTNGSAEALYKLAGMTFTCLCFVFQSREPPANQSRPMKKGEPSYLL